MNAPQDFRAMTSNTVGKDLLAALLAEIRLLPDVWPKLSKAKQDDVIDRLRKRVTTQVEMAVHVLSAQGRAIVTGELEQITIKDGAKAVLRVSKQDPHFLDMCEAEGQSVLLVVAGAADHTQGMDEIRGEDDQRSLDLGHEYHDNDGGGMDDPNVIDGEGLCLDAPDEAPTEEELDAQHEAGYEAAADGQPESACPVMKGALCIAWVKGWKAWHEQSTEESGANAPDANSPEAGNDAPQSAKYRHPTDKSLTWSGRGRKPMWVVAWLDDGGDLEDLVGN